MESLTSSNSTNINGNEGSEGFQSCYDEYFWPNGSKLLVHNVESNKHVTYTSPNLLPTNFSITIKFNKLQSKSHITIGVTDKIINESNRSSYLGGDYGAGNWGISGSGTTGEGGKWGTSNFSFGEGDTLTIFGNKGIMSFAVNGALNQDYKYNVGSSNIYLAVTLYYKDDTIEIYQETL